MGAQYPSEEILSRASIMVYWDREVSVRTNQMWINVRCYNIHDVPLWCWFLAGVIIAVFLFFYIRSLLKKKGQEDILEKLREKSRRKSD